MTFITFTIEPGGSARAGKFVRLRGKCFQVGDYPDKRFSLSEAEADAAIAAFQPVAMNYQHVKGPLDKKRRWGEILSLERHGPELFSTFSVPVWLHEIYKEDGEPLKVSMEWHPKTKRLVGGAWVVDPRIHDAHVAVFTRNDGADAPRRNSMNEELKQAYLKECAEKGQEPSDEILALFTKAEEAEEQKAETQRKTDARAFAAQMVADNRIVPADQELAAAAFFMAAEADAASEEAVAFSLADGGATGKRTDLIRKVYESRPKHKYTTETTPDPKLFSLGQQKPEPKADEDTLPDHREVYANRAKAANGKGE